VKKLAKRIVAAILGYQVRALTKKNEIKIIGVVGSIGKTSTKLAIGQVLGGSFKVQSQDGNYNDLVTVPLVFFGEHTPSLFNPFAWFGVFWRNSLQLRKPYPYDIVVLELGTDGPGQIEEFKRYLNLEIAIVTAITREHMEFFDTLEAIAKEELTVCSFSSSIIANRDLCDEDYLKEVPSLLTYSLTEGDFTPRSIKQSITEFSVPEQYSRLAAIAVASKFGIDEKSIQLGLSGVRPPAGRMQKLKGINGSTIIDDSYNASPDAVRLALDSLYKVKAPQKIAILGNMNELGKYSADAHTEIGEYCDPKQIDQVLTIGPDANKYLAESAKNKGCKVAAFDSPYKAGEFAKTLVKPGALILVKGSQNKVFAEEAIKSLLASPADQKKLVRQTPDWLKIKQKAFKQ
jgi:UDP-N-acetylmuramoyl-tripeptide--D-alanyl-D-alanine ligase